MVPLHIVGPALDGLSSGRGVSFQLAGGVGLLFMLVVRNQALDPVVLVVQRVCAHISARFATSAMK